MSASVNGTQIVAGPNVIQISDFYVKAGVLHPIIIGSISIITLFTYLRLGSNRSIAPLTVFDWIIDVALGSTLAGIVNGNDLVKGLIALATMLGFQYSTSTLGTRLPRMSWLVQGPPLVLAFRGKMLKEVMWKHRISDVDLNASLRQKGVLNISLVECAIIEPNGTMSVFTMKQIDDSEVDPDVLMAVPAYRALWEKEEEKRREGESDGGKGGKGNKEGSSDQNDAAMNAC